MTAKHTTQNRNVTLADVARLAGVSAKTVSRVINQSDYVSAETRAQIEKAIEELGYRPNRVARSLASNRSYIIGLSLPDVTNPFFPEILRGVQQEALQRGYHVLTYNTDLDMEREKQGLALLEEMRVDGIIVCTMRLPDDQLRPLLQRHRAVVLVNRVLAGNEAGIVRIDYFKAMQQIVQHLVDGGRRKIGYLDVSRSVASYSSTERFGGFQAAMAANGLTVNPDYIRRCAATIEGSSEAARDLLTASPELDAIICYNDVIAGGTLEACAALGVAVPDKVAVTGFDNIMFSSVFKVALTTAHVPRFELGIRAAQMLFNRIDGDTTVREMLLDTELFVRQSTPH